ncbi:apses transcription factor Xbp1 [Penicillium angulare]|uniref:apses transcription factor Xbp1 n=1 Tax=Penicillium angulare TaxID=116970 RepID=UPI002540CC4D|nr:apses transcription factor Xbp1 [Penicillium angulare]KAJ5272938.1 apses transcription factor Xbp1 [Penicillium angulare]
MSSIKDLLNPMPEEREIDGDRGRERPPAREKRTRMPKDAALFRPGEPRGEVRYPPIEISDESLLEKHRKFKLHPMGRIAEFPRHIPYQSDKKSFQEKTGRDSFNVFQYTFQIPGEETVWTVMWDYNIGLVRTTHLFKCNGHSKTAPGKVLNANSGLREICHSITGGSLAAQGYWMPYEAAKAVAATFCWKVRHVLTPLFGTEFPAMCIKPKEGSGTQTSLGQIIIEADIVHRATQTARLYRSLEMQKDHTRTHTHSPGPENTGKLLTADSENENDSVASAPHRRIYSKLARRSYAVSICSARGSSTEPPSYCNSPQSPTVNNFTPVNMPRTSNPVQMQAVPSPEEFVENCKLTREAQAQTEAHAHSHDRVRDRLPFLGGLFPLTNRLVSEESDLGSTSSIGNAFRSTASTSIDVPMGDDNENKHTVMRSGSSGSDHSFDSDDSAELADDDTDKDYSGFVGPKDLCCAGEKRGVDRDQGRRKKNPVRPLQNRKRGSELGHFAHEVKAAHALLRLHMDEALANDELLKESDWSPDLGFRKRRHASM